MRNRILKGHPALLGMVCLLAAGMLAGCGGGDSTYNPTGIGSSTPAPSFSLAVTPAAGTVVQGQAIPYTATLTALNGFSSPVTLSVSGLPTGATAAFSPAAVTSTANGAVGTVTVTTTAASSGTPGSLKGTIQSVGSTPTGAFAITVTATGAGIIHQAAATLTVMAAPSS